MSSGARLPTPGSWVIVWRLVDTLDWTEPGSATIVDTVRRHMHPGAVVLFHDGGGRRDETLNALRQVLPWLRAQGYSFVLPT